MMTSSSATLDGLPKQFVSAMRTLFDIMDDKRTGHVNFEDIENRWHDDSSKGLPKGVIESLRKVTPPNGLLTFERFCAGLKICLLRNQVELKNQNPLKPRTDDSCQSRPPSAPLLDIECPPTKLMWNNKAVAIRPNNVLIQQRILSMPQLLSERKENQQMETVIFVDKPASNISKPMLYGPPKPPRVSLAVERVSLGGNIDRAEIRTALQNWKMGLMVNAEEGKNEKRLTQCNNNTTSNNNNNNTLKTGSRSMGDGKASGQDENQSGGNGNDVLYQKKSKREPRRHTLQNGIDYNMLKRMKQIEQEKDVLMQGLGAIEKAREWYLKQVASIQEKMKYLGRMGHVEHWSEAQQERLELQRARVLEVNRHLVALTDSWERGGLPLHMNLAVHHYPQPSQDLTDRLKQQNNLLTECIYCKTCSKCRFK